MQDDDTPAVTAAWLLALLQAFSWVYRFAVTMMLRVPGVRSGFGVILKHPVTFTAGALGAAAAFLAAYLIQRRNWRGAALLAGIATLRLIAGIWTGGIHVGISILIPLAGLVAGIIAMRQLRASRSTQQVRA